MQLLCFCATLWLPGQIGSDFSVPKQKYSSNSSSTGSKRSGQTPLSIAREKSGQAFRSKVADIYFYKLSRQEGMLLRDISGASERRDWGSVQSVLGSYNGTAEPIYAAGIHAALRCGKYQEGALFYDHCKERLKITHMPVFVAALKIFGKCREPERAREVWHDALGAGDLDQNLALARMSAAADEGDVTTSAEVMDRMIESNVSLNVVHVTCAIRSCWGRGKAQHRAAKYFFDLMPELGIQPNVITFSSLMRTYTTASLKDILAAYEEMKRLRVEPNNVFAETYLIAVFQGIQVPRSPGQIAEVLRDMEVDRLRAARDALKDFEEARVRLGFMSIKISKALKLLSF